MVRFPFQKETSVSIAHFMAAVHKSVNEMSHTYLVNERRYNYTTPKSFLEQIKLYQNLLTAKHNELQASTVRLENGLIKLRSTSQQVSDAFADLTLAEVTLVLVLANVLCYEQDLFTLLMQSAGQPT